MIQPGGCSSPTASPTPPLLIPNCVPTAWKGQEGSPNSGKCRITTINPHKSQDICPSQHPCLCPALPCSRFLTFTCSLQFLPLLTLTVRANLQQKCHMKPPRSCRPPCLAPHDPERKGQARCPTVSHAGSTSSPGSNWPNSAQCWKQDCAGTSLARGKPGQPLWLHPAPKMGHSCKHCLHTGASTGQQHGPIPRTPAIPTGTQAAGIGPLCLKQEAGDKHKQLPKLRAPSKPRLSPVGAVPAESREGASGYIHLQLQALCWSSWPKPGPGRCREGTHPSTLQALGVLGAAGQILPHGQSPLQFQTCRGLVGLGAGSQGSSFQQREWGCGSVCRNCGCNRRQIGT